MAKKKNPYKKSEDKVSTYPGEAPVGGFMIDQSITDEMRTCYLDYAMSVIVSRALPDVRDGLKPVQRRILYAMWSIGLRANAKFRKSANVVGEVMAKYHPHGDSSIYEAMVRMAQDFSYRHPLVRGQGNFGSMDGDGAAAMRYTEAKLMPLTEDLLSDIEKDTVNFKANYDGSQSEPTVLPAKVPNLLINGTLGIAVGMATSIPPHNLSEVIGATLALMDNKDATLDDLLEHVKGPDFPTGATIYGANDIKVAYSTGRGGIVVRADAEIIENAKGTHKIIFHNVPYMTNKATLLEKIAGLVRDKKLEGIRDLRDESNKEGVRVVVELKKDAYPRKVLNRLYQLTPLQTSFHFNMVALVDGGTQPRILGLKAMLEEFIEHRRVVVRRRTEFDLARAQDRAHILEGLLLALKDIDKIISTIKKSKDREDAKTNLIKQFKMTERQAVAILDMRLQSLAGLERLKIETEYNEKMKLIKELESILKSDKKMMGVIREELEDMRARFGEERRTKIVKLGLKEFRVEDVIPDSQTIVLMTKDGYIKRIDPDTFKLQSRGGKGVAGLTTKEEDSVESIFSSSTHQDLMFFTSRGRVFKLKVYEIPEASRTAKGQAIVNFLELSPGESITATISSNELNTKQYIVMATRSGTIKKTEIKDFENVRRSGLIAIKLKSGDALEWVRASSEGDDVMLATANGMAIRFNQGDIRQMGRVSAGVRGIKMKGDDQLIGMALLTPKQIADGRQFMVISENGYGKRTNVKEYKAQKRGGTGIKTGKITAKTGKLVSARIVKQRSSRDLLVISQAGQVIRMGVNSVSSLGRATQGVRVMRFKKAGDSVSSVAFVRTEIAEDAVSGDTGLKSIEKRKTVKK
ncbi:DNA gyrase subunit A [Candidatus Uhrbacteria bacterium CG_4_10_14_0_2_um_filter_41_7]|uniref:DNA gyrase subunit A n=1 Tax=Candidatus Uhrbacteria bacterium CG_4_9_14_3_um_filter_41_35 TaxID=1975034 RepID=A0A2M7XEP3_9BACT|nr:MAG: DNA gyrase subunit A [Candidatus Uhrbacteria bacterium CG11_big_fil_rev_8_21_14_0_20_41_9]PIZ54961.1 MAG: DNA gyrase subunit A [Candidatus Uhrbacteria bacterium CG_4_10_14_0_2_um_filter_41_7]PJA46325.1 MAG: DNA gyrase subunit A [Candidatus Uhrbacteria bacterium CG_4_9_14_3_um_filter_41_35]